jgi:glycosyltransferase involved in cell wall biosynthesis
VTPSLRIGIDAREVLGDTTGVGRYLGELIRRWATRPDAASRHLLLYAPEPLSLALPAEAVTARIVTGGRGTWWEQTALRRAVQADRPDVFFAPAYTAPLGIGMPVAVTIHDISFVAHPEWFRPREGVRRRWLTRRAAENASVIFTDSDFSRREIESYFRVESSKIKVIPPGVTPRRGAAGLRSRLPLVLFVGSLFNRRRLPDLIAAFARVARDLPDARLAIVGDDRTWPPQDLRGIADAHGLGTRVDFRNYVPDDELARLYGAASVFAFLSEYEGFGLTPLEALAADVPVVVLDTPVAREVYGDAATYVRADDVTGTAAALRRLLTSPGAGATQLAHAANILARYSWEAAASRTLEHIERMAGR